MMHGLGRDLRLATRRLVATPLFTIFAVLSLAIGVGVTTATYSVVEQTFWGASPVGAPDRIVFVTAPGGSRRGAARLSHPDYAALRAAQHSIAGLAASSVMRLAVASPASTDLVSAEAVGGSYFEALGVRAHLGRTIQPSDDRARDRAWRMLVRKGYAPELAYDAVRAHMAS